MARIMLPARVDSCAPAMEFLCEHLAADYAGILNFVELAVEELLVNVATYAYSGPCPQEGGRDARWGQMELGFRRVSMDSTPFLCVWIRDWGTAFDPFMEIPTPDTSLPAEERSVGGLGVHLVKNVSAHHCYSGDDGTNTIELYFQLAGDEIKP